MTTPGRKRVLLDTSVLIGPDADFSGLVCQISSVSYAELHYGVQAARDPDRRDARQRRLTLIQATFGHGIAFTDVIAHHYGMLCARLRAQGRSPRGRALGLMFAATAAALEVPLVTRNPAEVGDIGIALMQR